jgi:hypothetical protein
MITLNNPATTSLNLPVESTGSHPEDLDPECRILLLSHSTRTTTKPPAWTTPNLNSGSTRSGHAAGRPPRRPLKLPRALRYSSPQKRAMMVMMALRAARGIRGEGEGAKEHAAAQAQESPAVRAGCLVGVPAIHFQQWWFQYSLPQPSSSSSSPPPPGAMAARRGSCLLRLSLDCLACPHRELPFVLSRRLTFYALFLYALPIYTHTHTFLSFGV